MQKDGGTQDAWNSHVAWIWQSLWKTLQNKSIKVVSHHHQDWWTYQSPPIKTAEYLRNKVAKKQNTGANKFYELTDHYRKLYEKETPENLLIAVKAL